MVTLCLTFWWITKLSSTVVASFNSPPRSVWQRRQWQPTPVFLPGKSQGQRSLVGCSPWGRWESNTTEQLPFHFSLSCIGEGNGNPLQCSCLENPRDGGAWWAAVYGVTQSRTRLKRLSSSRSVWRFIATPVALWPHQKLHGHISGSLSLLGGSSTTAWQSYFHLDHIQLCARVRLSSRERLGSSLPNSTLPNSMPSDTGNLKLAMMRVFMPLQTANTKK